MSSLLIVIVSMMIFIGIFGMWAVPSAFKKFKNRPDLTERLNIKKEKALLKLILTDIKANTNHWVQNGFAPRSVAVASMLINDHKNMIIKLAHKDKSVSIHFNFKDILSYDDIDDADAITTTITGEQALEFIKKATRLLDHRGKELEYFTEQLQAKL